MNSLSDSRNNVKEKLGTLRIIMLNIDESGESKVEVNKLITFNGTMEDDGSLFTGEGEEAAGFNYIFSQLTVEGSKKFYLIANESSVGEVFFSPMPDNSVSDNILAMTSLTEILNSYKTEIGVGENLAESPQTSRGNELETVMNHIWLNPDYKIDEDGNIFLPYTSVYEGFEVMEKQSSDNDLEELDGKMFLVPVASKFNFKFINYRKEKVLVKDIYLSKADISNYLNAQLDNNEKQKSLNGQPTYWIDWLAALTKASQNSSNPDAVNATWGWISDYNMPENREKSHDLKFIHPDNEWTIDSRINSYTPSTINFGPFYIPESHNIVKKETFNPSSGKNEVQELQEYYLSFFMHDEFSEEVASFENNAIANLKALFRATSITITVTLYDEDMDIYAEPSPWLTNSFYGYLEETDEETTN